MQYETITTYSIPTQTQRGMFYKMLVENLGDLDEEALHAIEKQCTWTMCKGGETLFRSGDPGDSAYFLVSGRLRAVQSNSTNAGDRQLLGEVAPGQTVGEISIFSGDSRTATVVAARDSVLVRVEATTLRKWFVSYPHGLVNLASLIVKRATSWKTKNRNGDHPKSIVIVPITPQADTFYLKKRLQAAAIDPSSITVIDAHDADQAISSGPTNVENSHRAEKLNNWLDVQESKYEHVICIANPDEDQWTRLCLRRADRIALLADPLDSREPSNFERSSVGPKAQRLLTRTFLILNHPKTTTLPKGTASWLEPRPWVNEHIHIREGDLAHISRLLRIITGNANGLVLGSGGARGLSHVGVFQALGEANIPVDRVGGTSIGAVIAACVANGWDSKEVTQNVQHAFGKNPTDLFDISLPPLISLYSGNKLHRLLSEFIAESTGIEDLWINYFCVSCDISDSSQAVHARGPLLRSIMASVALPGVFPPVRLQDGLHVDGAFMNALPVDIMASLDPGKIIAVDLSRQGKRTPNFDLTPTSLEFLFDKFRRRTKHRYRVPTIVSSIIQSSLLASGAKIAALRTGVDLLFNPDVHKFDLMDWASCGELIDIGYRHANTVLGQTAQSEASSFTKSFDPSH